MSSVKWRAVLAFCAVGLLLAALVTVWHLWSEVQRREARIDADLREIPLLYAEPLSRAVAEGRLDKVKRQLELIALRHDLQGVELRLDAGAPLRVVPRSQVEPGRAMSFPLSGSPAAQVRVVAPVVQASALMWEPQHMQTLMEMVLLVLVLGLAAVILIDRLVLQHLRRLSAQARAFDSTQPPLQAPTSRELPREVKQLEQAIAHVQSCLGDELMREQSQVRELRELVRSREHSLEQAERALALRGRELAALERHDPQTGLVNRREFDEVLRREFKRAQRDGGRLALAILDLDRFRLFNETHGRPAGDELLGRFARMLGERFKRDTDLVARLGGEEFVALLPGFDVEAAQNLLDQLRDDWRQQLQVLSQLGSLGIGQGAERQQVTVSIGLAVLQPGRPYLSPQAFLQAADDALHLAKHSGRDRLSMAA
ncbi:diguanylate cyclase [Roseateles sp. BYS180W]|uniref:diguanylate cyclase n=1 Tax=Roseateles rivi TaxID=3299028 RepID=A0ABW7FUI5_9BURK